MTAAEITALRAAWYAASLAVATGQEYQIAGRRLTRVDAAEIRRQFEYYDRLLSDVTAGRTPGAVRLYQIVPRDA